MRLYIYYAILFIASSLATSCGDDDKGISALSPSDKGTVTDNAGNTYGYVRIGNLDWTTSNALNGPGLENATYDYGGMALNVFSESNYAYLTGEYKSKFGNLMNFEEALKSAPDGWRLPSDEDWQALERALGMKSTGKNGWRGDGIAKLFIQSDTGTELGLCYGGLLKSRPEYASYVGTYFSLEMDYVEEDGFYWTSTVAGTESSVECAYFRHIFSGNTKVERNTAPTHCYMAVRWVRDSK